MCRLHPALAVREDAVRQCALNQRTLDTGSRPSLCAGRKLGVVEQALLWTLLHEHPPCPSRVLLDKIAQRQLPMVVRIRHLNRWRAPWQRNWAKGRPGPASCRPPVASGAEVVQGTPRLSFVGVHRCAHGLDHHAAFGPGVLQLTQAIEAHKRAHPDDDFALLHPREPTLRRRFQALFFAPLLGLAPLTACEPHEHPLPTLLGRGSQSAPRRQLRGPRERIAAAEALRPALVPPQPGQMISVNGHRIASWSRVVMHKGKSTMLGRSMAGAQAVIAHTEAGQALFVEDEPPARPVSQGIVEYGQKGVEATGLSLFVIDRAVPAGAMAGACAKQGWGLLCMLDDNEHDGLASFDATPGGPLDDGTKV